MQLSTWMLWAHLIATVVLVGYYAVLALVFLPVLGAARVTSVPTPGDPNGAPMEFLSAVERRAMPILVGMLVVFFVTGVTLLTGDSRYTGAGSIQSNWATLLLVKHVLIVGMLVLGSHLDGLIVRAAKAAGAVGFRRITWTARGMTALGAVVLLLTAAAQTS
jgi:voltage-gated potassium channel Kch